MKCLDEVAANMVEGDFFEALCNMNEVYPGENDIKNFYFYIELLKISKNEDL